MKSKRPSKRAKPILIEAMRRWLKPHDRRTGGDTMTKAWTGLGLVTEYAPAVKQGFMESATDSAPGCRRWYRLTQAGADVVAGWIGRGITWEHFNNFDLPFDPDGAEIPKLEMVQA